MGYFCWPELKNIVSVDIYQISRGRILIRVLTLNIILFWNKCLNKSKPFDIADVNILLGGRVDGHLHDCSLFCCVTVVMKKTSWILIWCISRGGGCGWCCCETWYCILDIIWSAIIRYCIQHVNYNLLTRPGGLRVICYVYFANYYGDVKYIS